MPAAAVIPAPIAYINAVAVKKLVVGSRRVGGGSFFDVTAPWRGRSARRVRPRGGARAGARSRPPPLPSAPRGRGGGAGSGPLAVALPVKVVAEVAGCS